MSLLAVKPQFLYPHSRQFPFDKVAENIVKAIEKRNWKVPGLEIEFDTYGSGERKYQMIRQIIGTDFKLYFCRGQGILDGKWNNTAALQTVWIPKQSITVYEDESGPTYYLYVGKDWDAEKDWFMNSIKVNSKLHGEPRRYLRYTGNQYQRRSENLYADNDNGREYTPRGEEPTVINLEQKFNEFTAWLEEYVLKYILSFDEAEVVGLATKQEEIIPYEGPWELVYSVCNYDAAVRIAKGKKDPKQLEPEMRHAYFGSGHRLVPLYVKGDFPKIAYEGFVWCDVNQTEVAVTKHNFNCEVWSAMSTLFSDEYFVTIKPKYANHVYVVDNSKYEETRQELFEKIAPRDRLTTAELNSALVARGATIIPITEYKGDYKDPILLFDRELDFDEIESIVPCEK